MVNRIIITYLLFFQQCLSFRKTICFVSTVGSFSNSLNQSYFRNDSWNARFRLEWKPDTVTNIIFRPNFKYSKSDVLSTSNSASL